MAAVSNWGRENIHVMGVLEAVCISWFFRVSQKAPECPKRYEITARATLAVGIHNRLSSNFMSASTLCALGTLPLSRSYYHSPALHFSTNAVTSCHSCGSLLKTNGNCSKCPVHESSVGVKDVGVELGQCWVEVGAVSKLHGDWKEKSACVLVYSVRNGYLHP